MARHSVMSTASQVIHSDAVRLGVIIFSWLASKVLLLVILSIQLVPGVFQKPVYLNMITEVCLIFELYDIRLLCNEQGKKLISGNGWNMEITVRGLFSLVILVLIALCMAWVCCWFSSLLQGVFSGFSGFPPLTKPTLPKFLLDLEKVDVYVSLLISIYLLYIFID